MLRASLRALFCAGCVLLLVSACVPVMAARQDFERERRRREKPATAAHHSTTASRRATKTTTAASASSGKTKSGTTKSSTTASAGKRSTSKSTSTTHPASTVRTTGKRSSQRKKSTLVRGQQRIDSERAQAIQEALIREHYLNGEPTGSWNQASEEAMRRYQADHGWQSKQVPDSRALIKLGLGPSKDHLLNPESAMTTVPDPPRAEPMPTTSHSASPTTDPSAAPAAAPSDSSHPNR